MKTQDADAVQVMRCKDCMYGIPCGMDGLLMCGFHKDCMYFVRYDEYCSNGSKKEGCETHAVD